MNRIHRTLVDIGARTYKNFYTLIERPLSSAHYGLTPPPPPPHTSLGIILQGPLLHDKNFTIETVKLYRKNFPAAQVIVSTWNDENDTACNACTSAGAIVVRSEKPPFPGSANINFQIVSTKRGVDEALRHGVTHILKSRTDQRIYSPTIFRDLLLLQDQFPVTHSFPQQKRIVVTSSNSFLYRPYSLTDMFVFGTSEDMSRYWNIPLDTRTLGHTYLSMIDWSRARPSEAYIMTNYVESLGRTPSWSLRDSWEIIRDHYCIIDHSMIDLFWYKYGYETEYRRKQYEYTKTDQEFTFLEWLDKYQCLTPETAVPEEIASMPFGVTL